MFKIQNIWKLIFISLIVLLTYIPIFFAVVFSFSSPSQRGFLSFTSFNYTSDGSVYTGAYAELFSDSVLNAIANSTIIAFLTVIIIIPLSLLIVFGLWRQRQKAHRVVVEGLANIALVNPDIITALGLGILMTSFFGAFSLTDEGLIRAVISHVVVILPFVILMLFPRSEKFNPSLFKASQDLGYGKIRTWFNTYLKYMALPIFLATVVTVVLSFDDFILARITSNVETLGVQLYGGTFRPWALALGTFLLAATLIGNIVYILLKIKKNIAIKKEVQDNEKRASRISKITVKQLTNLVRKNKKEVNNVES
ncbi:ABC transporter permease [Mycoplasmopsis agassizii]|uniref:ABC transporter permease n=1 Tax=Mycoplasmopsis agassizii TaxID=33922 RepID=UPI0009D87A6F|nr:spermidine/putrescine ABC transporter permease [Mycoplasmopsis agassizii]SMC18628.1 spermidine/putrescine transport system permease protein [Mycoplasmopsis agassizii]